MKRIIRKSITISLIILSLILSFSFVRQVNDNTIYASEIQEEAYDFYPLIEKFSYETDEDIDLSFCCGSRF